MVSSRGGDRQLLLEPSWVRTVVDAFNFLEAAHLWFPRVPQISWEIIVLWSLAVKESMCG